jgi:hypothetical protein
VFLLRAFCGVLGTILVFWKQNNASAWIGFFRSFAKWSGVMGLTGRTRPAHAARALSMMREPYAFRVRLNCCWHIEKQPKQQKLPTKSDIPDCVVLGFEPISHGPQVVLSIIDHRSHFGSIYLRRAGAMTQAF